MRTYIRVILPSVIILIVAVVFAFTNKTAKVDVTDSIKKMSVTDSSAKKGEIVAQNSFVMLETNRGDITLELFNSKAPVTVDNFLNYVESYEYDSTIFHRVIKNFMIQGGGFTTKLQKKDSRFAPIANEGPFTKERNSRGTVAMARTNDPNSATNQFFINTRDNLSLDWDNEQSGYGYAVFGKVIKGMDVVDSIENSQTTKKGRYSDVPFENVIIYKARIIK